MDDQIFVVDRDWNRVLRYGSTPRWAVPGGRVRRIVLLWLTLCACSSDVGPLRGAARPAAPPTEAGALRAALATFQVRDAALGPYAAARDEQMTAWQRAAADLDARLARVEARPAPAPRPDPDAADGGVTRAEVSLPAPGPGPVPRCAGQRCCIPSLPPPLPQPPRRPGQRRVIVLDDFCDLHGPTPRPIVLWSSQRRRIDVPALGAELARALEAGDAGRAAPLAALLRAELELRRREATFARSEAAPTAFSCGPLGGQLASLLAAPAVAAPAGYLRTVCADLAEDGAPLPPAAGAPRDLPAGDDLVLDEAWRLALQRARAGEPEAALPGARGLEGARDARLDLAARVLASHLAFRLDRYPEAMAELSGVGPAVRQDAALYEIAARFAAAYAIEWQDALAGGLWPGGAGEPAPASPTEPACGALEVLQANLQGSPLLQPAMRHLADLSFDMTMYPEAIAGYRALLAQGPTSPDVLHARARIHEALVRQRFVDEARTEAAALAAALAPGSPWARANAADAALLARAQDLVARVQSGAVGAGPATTVDGVLDRSVALRVLDSARTPLAACLWAGPAAGARPTWARLALRVEPDGRIGATTARTSFASAAVDRCLTTRARGLRMPAPEGGAVDLEVWVVAP